MAITITQITTISQVQGEVSKTEPKKKDRYVESRGLLSVTEYKNV